MSYFGKTVSLDKDIARHRTKETLLRKKIAELEIDVQTCADERDRACAEKFLKAYKELLVKLLESKADITSQIGQKK